MPKNTRVKTLLFTLEYPPFRGGVSNYYANTMKYWLDRKGIHVLYNNGRQLISDRLPALRWLPSVWFLWRAVIKDGIGHILVGHILPLGTATRIVTWITRTPYTVFLHGMDFTLVMRKRRRKWLARLILTGSKNIICANSYTAGLVRDWLPEEHREKIFVVNPGIEPLRIQENIKSFQPKAGPPRAEKHINSKDMQYRLRSRYNLDGKMILFSIGRLVKRKGFDRVIEIMPRILDEIPNTVYVIAGAGPDEDYLKELAASVGDGSAASHAVTRIIFTGCVSEPEKWAWLDICDIMVMPARRLDDDFEGFGIVYLEANLADKPVIAGRSGGVQDAVIDYKTGILVDPENDDDLYDGIIELLRSGFLRRKLGQQGWRRAIEEFNWERQARKIYYIINR